MCLIVFYIAPRVLPYIENENIEDIDLYDLSLRFDPSYFEVNESCIHRKAIENKALEKLILSMTGRDPDKTI